MLGATIGTSVWAPDKLDDLFPDGDDSRPVETTYRWWEGGDQAAAEAAGN